MADVKPIVSFTNGNKSELSSADAMLLPTLQSAFAANPPNGFAYNFPMEFMALNAAYTTPVGTVNVLKQLFNTPAGGTFNGRATTAYEFECLFTLTGISATSGTVSFGFLGTATYTNVYMQMIYERAALINTATASLMNSVSTATPGTVGAANRPTTAASTSTVGNFMVKGIIRVNAAGTIIPAIALSVAAACVVGNGSHFKVKPLGINTVTSVGGFV